MKRILIFAALFAAFASASYADDAPPTPSATEPSAETSSPAPEATAPLVAPASQLEIDDSPATAEARPFSLDVDCSSTAEANCTFQKIFKNSLTSTQVCVVWKKATKKYDAVAIPPGKSTKPFLVSTGDIANCFDPFKLKPYRYITKG